MFKDPSLVWHEAVSVGEHFLTSGTPHPTTHRTTSHKTQISSNTTMRILDLAVLYTVTRCVMVYNVMCSS